jgi:hypothetical protein
VVVKFEPAAIHSTVISTTPLCNVALLELAATPRSVRLILSRCFFFQESSRGVHSGVDFRVEFDENMEVGDAWSMHIQ